MKRILTGGAALAVLLSAGAALAQNPQVPLQGRDTDPNMPAPQSTVPEKVRPGSEPSSTGTTSEGRGNLSDKLERSGGVINPGNADSGAVVKPPVSEPNSTPVIRPPSGDVQPK